MKYIPRVYKPSNLYEVKVFIYNSKDELNKTEVYTGTIEELKNQMKQYIPATVNNYNTLISKIKSFTKKSLGTNTPTYFEIDEIWIK